MSEPAPTTSSDRLVLAGEGVVTLGLFPPWAIRKPPLPP